MRRHKKVMWVGGPFDTQTFKVPHDQQTIKVGTTMMRADLDAGGRAVVTSRHEIEWPIIQQGRRFYVMYSSAINGSSG